MATNNATNNDGLNTSTGLGSGNYQVPMVVGASSAAPLSAVTLMAGSGVNFTYSATSGPNNTPGLTLSGGGASGWTINTTTTSQPLAAGNGYTAKASGVVPYTLPQLPKLGDTYYVVNSHTTAAGWTITKYTGSSQVIQVGNVRSTTNGSIAATDKGDSVQIVCIDNTTSGSEVFACFPCNGNITVNA